MILLTPFSSIICFILLYMHFFAIYYKLCYNTFTNILGGMNMKNPLINGFRKTKRHLITWKSKQTIYDYFSYLSIIIGIIIGVIANFLLQLNGPWVAYISVCIFCASITLVCYILISCIVYAIKNFKKN